MIIIQILVKGSKRQIYICGTNPQKCTFCHTISRNTSPNSGGILKDSVINENPFTVKGQSITLPNSTDKLYSASLFATCFPCNSKFQRYFDAKLDIGIGVIYESHTNDTE